MASSDYSFIDIAVLDEVRTRFAEGDGLAILSADLEEVIWANGSGAALFGYPDIEAIMGASAGLAVAQRRQIAATPGFPDIGRDRPLMIRLSSGLTSRVTRFLASSLTMPDGEPAILLAAPAATANRDPGETARRAVSGFTEAGYFAALVGEGGRILAASPGYEALGIAPDTITHLVMDVAEEGDRLVKRLIESGRGRIPAGIARLTDEPAAHLLVVVDDDGYDWEETPSGFVADGAEEEGTSVKTAPSAPDVAPSDTTAPDTTAEDAMLGEMVPDDNSGPGEDTTSQIDRWYFEDQERAGTPAGGSPLDDGSGPETSVEASVAPEAELVRVDTDTGDDGAIPAGDGSPAGAAEALRPGNDIPETAEAEPESVPESRAASAVPPSAIPTTPVRFVWRTDAEGRFSLVSPEFTAALGEPAGGIVGRTFAELAAALGIDPEGDIAGLLARRDTWSGKCVLWPIAGAGLRVPVDLAALPVYARDRSFEGFRGFGIARMADAVIDENPPVPVEETPAAPLEAVRSDMPPAQADSTLAETSSGTGETRPDAPVAETSAHDEAMPSADAPALADIEPRREVPVIAIETALQRRRRTDKVIRLAEHRAQTQERKLSPGESSAFREIGERLKEIAEPAAVIPASAGIDAAAEARDDDASAEEALAGTISDSTPEEPVREVPAETRREAATEEATAPISDAPSSDIVSGDEQPISAGPVGEEPPPMAAGAEEEPLADAADHPPVDDLPREQADDATIGVTPEGEAPERGDVVAEQAPATATDHGHIVAEAPGLDGEDVDGATRNPSGDRDADETDIATAAAGASSGAAANENAPHRTARPAEPERTDALAARLAFLPSAFAAGASPAGAEDAGVGIFAGLPVPILIHSGDILHFANDAFWEMSGYRSLDELYDEGGLGGLFVEPYEDAGETPRRSVVVRARDGREFPVHAHLQRVPWRDGRALLLAFSPLGGAWRAEADASPAVSDTVQAAALAEYEARVEEMRTILDTATDGVILIAPDGSIRSINRPAEALFGYESAELAGKAFTALFAVESQRAARDYLQGLSDHGVASVLNDGREVIGREAQGRFIPLFMTIGRLPRGNGFCAVMRDITSWKRAEEELTQARVLAERASRQKTEFLARVSHEIRTPLNAIIGFSELMVDEKFGPVGNDRYRDYLRDINRSGNHVLDLVNDLLDISKIEAGEQEMSYEAVSLNDTLAETVALMQPQANRERVIIRSSFASRLPDVVADRRSIRQIGLNLLSNAVRFTQPGGQVIVSTSYETTGDVVLRVRDTGVGMSSAEIEQALKPFKQINSLKRSRMDGTGLGLPLTKAMVEANRARFAINSTPGEGTLVEIVFPSTRVLSD